MDFSSQPFPFTAGQPYQSFMSVPPLTPSNSHSAGSDDYNTASPAVSTLLMIPRVCKKPCHARAWLSLFFIPPHHGSTPDGLAPDGFVPSSFQPRREPALTSLKKLQRIQNYCTITPYILSSLTVIRAMQDGFDGIPNTDQFQGFEYNQGFHNPSQHQTPGFPGPPTPPNPATYTSQQSISQLHQAASSNGPLNSTLSGARSDGADDNSHTRGGSDEDDSLTPAQSRRKAQNRAAQRAFRERKEKHVKDLEAKLAHMEAAQQQASVENERLKRDLQKVSTENEILRATSSVTNGHHISHSPEPTTTGPMRYNPTDFYSNVLQNHKNKSPSHRIVTSDDGERLLAAGAAWDFIIDHDLYKRGLVDVGDVSERLKSCALCDGQGPVFSERSIVHAMEQSVASGSDDLL
ncbi:bZIP transcription factor (Fcr3) [Metarhizium guizhouense ARSEF 977]|uniref:BZIP transcription factor (Fcr3) n=1 Tax=Metarhizium guizhouense (strain ARSEF 977) TaxID=1276136 RepID=A0A0B4HHY9_METGA|nr:bZIP transcription factor (Fcr3) [Metarhizium guizhouense ARSEF 977]